MARLKYEIRDLLNDIQGSANRIGEDLTYTSVYDDIKQARFEEDDQLSQGIWERDRVKADWELVETLSVKAIQKQSKDLQIVGWLLESLLILDNFKGIAIGIDILSRFIQQYWNTCYPILDDGKSDNEQKLRILEWIYESIYRRSLLIPILGNNTFSLYNYEYALDLKSTILQNPQQADSILDSAKSSNIKTIDDINNIVQQTDQSVVDQLFMHIDDIYNNINNLKQVLKDQIENDKAFTKLLNNLDKIRQLLKHKKENKLTVEQSSTEVKPSNNILYIDNSIFNRNDIYNAIEKLSKMLEAVDKHSPSPYLLFLVLSWKDKTLLEIMNDLKTGNSEAHQLLKIMLS